MTNASSESAFAQSPSLSPRERLLPYQDRLRREGWTVRIETTATRARLEAFHPSGAAAMAAARRDVGGERRRTALYVFHARGQGPELWLGVRKPAFEHFAAHRSLPPGTRTGKVRSKCRCSRPRFHTERRAQEVLRNVPARQREEDDSQPVRRVYRCPDDERAWHLNPRSRQYSKEPDSISRTEP